jgi:phage I-like protein
MPKNINALLLSLNAAAAAAPEWLHLLPSASFTGVDGRGPYAAPDAAALISLFNQEGKRLPVDENHSIDLAGKTGHPSPARGWIIEMQAREDGVWGRVEWTAQGEQLVTGKEYGYLSPVFLHTAAKPYRITKVLRVALTNDPNLNFLTSLHQQEESVMLEELRKALGLPETATEAEVLAAVSATHAARQADVALMAQIRTAAGLGSDVAGEAVVTAIQSRGKVTAPEAENAELRTQLVSLQSQLTTLATTTARDKAISTIETAIQNGKIVPVLKEHMIARHMKNPGEVEAEIAMMPSLNAGGLGGRKQVEAGEPALTGEDRQLAAMMGFDEKIFAEQAKALHGKDL